MCLAVRASTGGTQWDEKINIDGESVQCLHCNANMGEDSIECGTCGSGITTFVKTWLMKNFVIILTTLRQYSNVQSV